MAYNNFEGSKYNAAHTREERKAAILAHLKTLIPAGARITLREGRGVGTMSLTSSVGGLPFPMVNVEAMEFEIRQPSSAHRISRNTAQLDTLLRLIENEAEAFGFDKSEIETDYFHRAFYFHSEAHAAEFKAERQAILFAASPKRAAIETAINQALAVLSDLMKERGQKAPDYWGDAFHTARFIDKEIGGTKWQTAIHEMQADLRLAEDFNRADADAAQLAHVAARVKPVKSAPAKKAPAAKVAATGDLSPAQKAWVTRRANAAKAVAA